ncbi:MAG: alanine racemase [Acetobacteraceae bacterium]
MKLADLPTPCLVLDRGILLRNIGTMARWLARHRVPLRPHMKTAKSIEVARLATAGQPGGITVSTLAEAEYFAGYGITDILYAVGITPQKLDQVAKLNGAGAAVIVLTDDLDTASAIAAHRQPPRVLIEIDTGEGRGGVAPDDYLLLEIAARLGPYLAGVMTHAGHSYAGRTLDDIAQIAETERAGVVRAAERLREAGHPAQIVSMGSSPTALHARHLDGVTEVRAGVYMFGDLFQAEIGTHDLDSIALTVLTSVIGPAPRAAAGGCRRAGAVQGPQHRRCAEGLRLRAGAGCRRPAQPWRRRGPPRLPGAWRGGGRSGVSAGPADRRQAAHRAQPYLHDRGGRMIAILWSRTVTKSSPSGRA